MKTRWSVCIIVMLAVETMHGSANVVYSSEALEQARKEAEEYVAEIQAMDMVEYLNTSPYWNAIATPTGIVLKPNPDNCMFFVSDMSRKTEARRMELQMSKEMFYLSRTAWTERNAKTYVENNKDVILTPDREMMILSSTGNGYNQMVFTPVSFKDQSKGVRMTTELNWYWLSPPFVAVIAKYIAFGETPKEMTEDDVADIMEWAFDKDLI